MGAMNATAVVSPPIANHAAEEGASGLPDPVEAVPWLPCTITLELPLVHFTVDKLSKLSKGSVVSTACPRNSDIPLYVNGQIIGWTELEVIDDHLAVRIMEIA
jgi:flagellar motor switch/type III secretory pathway protein FliN